MAMKVGELYETMELRDSGFKRSLSSVGSRAGGLMKTLGKTGLIGVVAGVGAAFVGMAAKGKKNMKKVHDLTKKYKSEIGATEEETQEFSDTITKLHKQNTDSYEELASAVTTLKQKHGSATQGMTQDFLDYAKVTEQDTAQAIKQVHSMQKAWNLDIAETSTHLDKLKSIQAETGASASEMQKSLAEIAPSMKAMNMNFDEGVAMMGQFVSQGVEVQQAERGMRQMMDRMADPTKQQAEAMKKLGVEVEKTGDGFETSEGAVKQLISRLSEGKLSSEEMSAALDILGKRSGTGMVRAMQNGEEGMKEFMKTVKDSEGAVKSASETYDKQLGERWTLIKRQYLEPFMETLGTGLINILEGTLGFLEKWGPKVQKVFANVTTFFGKMFGSGGKTNQFLADLQESFLNIFSSLKTIISTFISWGEKFWSAFGDTIIEYAEYFWIAVKEIFKTGFDIIEGYMKIFEGIFTGDWEKAKEGAMSIVESMWESIQKIFDKAVDVLKTLITDLGNAIIGLFDDMGVDVVKVSSRFLQKLQDTFVNALNSIAGKIGDFVAETVERFKWMHHIVPGLTKEMFEGAKSGLRDFKLASDSLGQGAVDGFIGQMKRLKTNTDKSMNSMVKGANQDFRNLKKNSTTHARETKENVENEFRKKANKVENQQKREKQETVKLTKGMKDQIFTEITKLKNKSNKKTGDMADQIIKNVDGLTSKSKEKIKGMVDKWVSETEEGKSKTESKTQEWASNIKGEFSSVSTDVKGTVSSMMGSIVDKFTSGFGKILKGTVSLKEGLKNIAKGSLQTIKNEAGSWLTDKASSWVGSAVGTAIGGPAGGFLGKVGGDIAGDVVGGAVDWVGNLFGLAKGGVAVEQATAKIGEGKHDEAVLPLSTKTYNRMAQGMLDQLKGGMNGVTDTATIIFELDGETVAKAVEQPLADRIRIKGGVGI